MPIWHELNIKRTRDRVAIARAYAERLAEVDPVADPGRAEALCDAYRRAHRFCDAMDSGPVKRIAPRGPAAARGSAARPNPVRPRRVCPARIRDSVRAVEELTGTVTAALHGGDHREAIAALRGLFRDPLFANLPLRWAVEVALLEEIGRLEETPIEFGLAAVTAFHWDDDVSHLPAAARAIAARLCAIADGDRRVAGLRRAARHWALRMWFDRRALAAALLTGHYRPWLFRLALLDPLTARAMRGLLSELRAHGDTAVERTLDRGVIAWWDEALGHTAQPPSRPDRAA